MEFAQWLEIADEDQRNSTDESGSHLFANYHYARANKLISKAAHDRFVENLAKVPGATKIRPEDRAGQLLYKSALEQFRSGAARPADFRLIGRSVTLDQSEVLVSIGQRTLQPVSSTEAGARRTLAAPQLPNIDSMPEASSAVRPAIGILWLTRLDTLLLSVRAASPKSKEEFFILLADCLGLKPTGGTWADAIKYPWEILITARLYATTGTEKAIRPHALSYGYSDRFSGVTIHAPYGSTAKCSTGEPCLPEAIIRHNDLAEISPSDVRYQAFCDELASVNPALGVRTPGMPINLNIASDSFEPKGGYLALRKSILSWF